MLQLEDLGDIDLRPILALVFARTSFVSMRGGNGEVAGEDLTIELNSNLARRSLRQSSFIKIDGGIDLPNIDWSFEFDELLFTDGRSTVICEIVAVGRSV